MNNIKIDSAQVLRHFDNIKTAFKKDVMMKGLVAGGKELQQATKQRLLQKFPKATYAKGQAKRPMSESIRLIKENAYTEVIISIMSNYLNIFFEGGTDKRYLKKNNKKDSNHHKTYKKGEYRGRIKPLNFFSEAQQQSHNNIINAIENEIIKEMDKIN